MVFDLFKKKNKKKDKEEEGTIDVSGELKKDNKDQFVNVEDKLNKGYIQARIILEILGAPKEHIELTLHEFVEKVKDEKGVIFINVDFSDTEKQDKMFSKFAEVELLFKNASILIGFCFDYMPSSVEIIEPEKAELTSSDLSMLFNDLQAKLHKIDMTLKQTTIENKNLRTNAAALLRNLILTVLKQKALNIKDVSRKVGIPEEQLKPFLETLKKQGFVKESKGIFSDVKQKIKEVKEIKPKKQIKKSPKKSK